MLSVIDRKQCPPSSESAIFRRYQIDFGRMGHMSEAEIEQAIEPFLKEVGALIDEHGREAVLQASLLLPTGWRSCIDATRPLPGG
jgi:hypothetical protein